MKQRSVFRARIAASLTLAAWFLIIGPGCDGGGGTTTPNCNSSGGGSGGDGGPYYVPIPLSRYVGTWQGTWSVEDGVPGNNGSEPARGQMTLTVNAAGSFSGQLTDAITGQSGSVVGTITAEGVSGTADITTTFGDQSERDVRQIVITQNEGDLAGSMQVRIAPSPGSVPGTPTPSRTLASFRLIRQ